MKKIVFLLLIFIGSFFINKVYSQNIKPSKSIEQAISNLFYIYKNQDFKTGIHHTTGKMNRVFKDAISYQKSLNMGEKPVINYFYSMLDSFTILNKLSKDKIAKVSVVWLAHIPLNNSSYYSKMLYADYLLENINGFWKIRDARFNNEYILNNKKNIENIYNSIE